MVYIPGLSIFLLIFLPLCKFVEWLFRTSNVVNLLSMNFLREVCQALKLFWPHICVALGGGVMKVYSIWCHKVFSYVCFHIFYMCQSWHFHTHFYPSVLFPTDDWRWLWPVFSVWMDYGRGNAKRKQSYFCFQTTSGLIFRYCFLCGRFSFHTRQLYNSISCSSILHF